MNEQTLLRLLTKAVWEPLGQGLANDPDRAKIAHVDGYNLLIDSEPDGRFGDLVLTVLDLVGEIHVVRMIVE